MLYYSLALLALSTTSLLSGTHSVQAERVDFESCDVENSYGIVTSVDVSPCDRKDTDGPCRFRFGHDYAITIGYTSLASSGDKPRASLVATDDTKKPPVSYAYSGQAFDACEYTECPIKAGVPSTYTYNFHTLKSHFNHLTFNATLSIDGPSFLCVDIEAQYVPSVAGRKLK